MLKGMNDNKNEGAKPSISRESGGGLTRSDNFKGGLHSHSCVGGEKAVDLPHVSGIFQDIVSEFTENSGIVQVQQNQNLNQQSSSISGHSGDQTVQNHMIQQVLKGDEKAVDLPHMSDIFRDIVSDFIENGFFDNGEPGWK
ncbi:hypothetical protein Tco_1471293, partial [Tanacetum coccineum]